jgi:hypothetical protein
MLDLIKKFRCSHCGNITPHKLIFECPIVEEIEEDCTANGQYYISICPTCGNIILHLCMEYETEKREPSFYESSIIWPKPKEFSKGIIPPNIIKTYNEALKVKTIAPSLFALQIGKALEFLCKEQRAQGKTLSQQITYLSGKGVIPPTLAKMTDIMKSFRNIAAHASELEIDSWEADVLDDFFNVIIEYVYLAPLKVESLMKRINKKSGRNSR